MGHFCENFNGGWELVTCNCYRSKNISTLQTSVIHGLFNNLIQEQFKKAHFPFLYFSYAEGAKFSMEMTDHLFVKYSTILHRYLKLTFLSLVLVLVVNLKLYKQFCFNRKKWFQKFYIELKNLKSASYINGIDFDSF